MKIRSNGCSKTKPLRDPIDPKAPRGLLSTVLFVSLGVFAAKRPEAHQDAIDRAGFGAL